MEHHSRFYATCIIVQYNLAATESDFDLPFAFTPLTKITAAQNKVALSYRRVRGLHFPAVIFVVIINFKHKRDRERERERERERNSVIERGREIQRGERCRKRRDREGDRERRRVIDR